MENWRFFEENPDYMISDHGRVLSLKRKVKVILRSEILAKGYETIQLQQKGIVVLHCVHRLVAKAFIPNPEHLPQINHIDGNTMNNHVSNLEWCDAYTNAMHAVRTGLRPVGVGSQSVPCAITDDAGKILRAYPSIVALSKEEHLNISSQNWLRLQLRHPERVRQHALRTRQHRSDAFIIDSPAPDCGLPIPDSEPHIADFKLHTPDSKLHVPDFELHTSSPLTPVRHSVTKQYYRQLSAEEAISFGFTPHASSRRQERKVEQ